MADNNDRSLFGRARSGLARLAELAPTQDDSASPQARDEDPHTVGREEFREEVDEQQVGDFVREYNRNPLIRVPIQNFAADVTEPGVSVEVTMPDDSDIPMVSDSETVPKALADRPLDDALEKWLSTSYIDGWSFEGSFTSLLENAIKDRRGRRGTSIIEHVYDSPTERDRLMALRPIRTETVTAYTREGKRIVLRGDDDPGSFDTVAVNDSGDPARDIAPQTPAGKTAAIAQFDEVFGSSERDEIPFAYDDITFSAYDSDTGVLFGRPDSATILNRAASLRKKLRYVDQSIINTAFGNIIATVETQDPDVVTQVKENLDVNVKERGVRDQNPETVSATNAPVEINEIQGQVPSITDHIQQEIEFVLTSMPTPLYRVGFAGGINRDVTSEQGEDYRDQVKRERRRLEADFRRVLEMKAKELLLGDPHSDEDIKPDVQLRIRPSTSTSPLRDEEFNPSEFSSLMSGLSTAAGPKGGATAILPKKVIIETILDMDSDEVMPDSGGGGGGSGGGGGGGGSVDIDPPSAPGSGSDSGSGSGTDSDSESDTGGDSGGSSPFPQLAEQSDEIQEVFDEFTDSDTTVEPESEAGATAVLADISVFPSDADSFTVTEAWLNRWAEWVASGRPSVNRDVTDRLVEPRLFAQLDWNPALHPRDPETGQFVERSFGVPSDAPNISEMDTKETLEYLDASGEDINTVLDPDSEVTIDGVPNNAQSLDDVPADPDSTNPDIPDGDGGDSADDADDSGTDADADTGTIGDTGFTASEIRDQATSHILATEGNIEDVTSVNGTPVAVTDTGINVRASYNAANPDDETIIASAETWDEMSDTEREVAIEMADGSRQSVLASGDTRDEDMSMSDIQNKHLNAGHEAALERTSADAIRKYARGIYNRERDGDAPMSAARREATYAIRGVTDEVDVVINGEKLRASDLSPELRAPGAVETDPDDADLDIRDKTAEVSDFDPQSLAESVAAGNEETRSEFTNAGEAGDISQSTYLTAQGRFADLLTGARDEEFAEALTDQMAYIADETDRAFAMKVKDSDEPFSSDPHTIAVFEPDSSEVTMQHEFGHNILHAFGHSGAKTDHANTMNYYPDIDNVMGYKEYMVGKGIYDATGTGPGGVASVEDEFEDGTVGTGTMDDVRTAMHESQQLDDVEDRVEELAKEVNKAFKRITLSNKRNGIDEASEMTIKDGYSSTNAHEVMSQLNELMQTEAVTLDALNRRDKLVQNHPELLGRYLALLEPAEEAAEKFSDELP